MKRIFGFLVVLLLWTSTAFAFMGVQWPSPGTKAWSGGGGGPTYFYTASLTDTQFTTGSNSDAANYILAGQIAPTINGNATKLRASVSGTSGVNVRMCLFTDATPAVNVAECVATTSGTSQQWVECTVSYAVNDTTGYIVGAIPQATLNIHFGPSGGAYYASGAYGSACPASVTFNTDSDTHGMGLGVQ